MKNQFGNQATIALEPEATPTIATPTILLEGGDVGVFWLPLQPLKRPYTFLCVDLLIYSLLLASYYFFPQLTCPFKAVDSNRITYLPGPRSQPNT